MPAPTNRALICFVGSLFLFSNLACEKHKERRVAGKYRFIEEGHGHITGKALRLMQTEIRQLKSGEFSVTFEALVIPTRDFETCTGQWKLPDGVEIVSGDLKQDVSLQAGEHATFTIEVEKKNLKPGDKIFFFSYEQINGENHGSPSLFVYGEDKKQLFEKSNFKKFKKIYQ